MEPSKDLVAAVAERQFERLRNARRWWKGLTEEERRSAYEAWLEANPGDYRAGWGYKLASISRNSMESVWEHHNP